jgi:hypothetical protein
MNPTMTIIFTVAGGALVLLSLYGAAKMNRKLFISGFCFYSVLPVIGESMAYNADSAPVHIAVIFLFLVQFVLMFPDNIVYGRDDTATTSLATKIGLAVFLINLGSVVFILVLKAAIPVQYGYYHAAFALIMLFVLYKRFSGTMAWAKQA